MNLIFLGKQGVGKGTYAQRFGERNGIPQIATGDLLREEAKSGSELGKKVQAIMASGVLVPTETVGKLLEKRLLEADAQNGFILDGFPRSMEQAQELDRILKHIHKQVELVINFSASDATLFSRLSGRRTCSKCSKIYHLTNIPPKVPGKCDIDGADLYQREDDKEEAIQKRFAIYDEQTRPVIAFYREKNLLVEIDSDREIEAVLLDVKAVVAEKVKK